MRVVKILLLLFFVLSITSLMHASGITDPRILVSEPACGEGDAGAGLTFGFDSNQTLWNFCNNSGQNWSTLVISFDATIDPGTIFCGGEAFGQCQVFANGVLVNTFFAGDTGESFFCYWCENEFDIDPHFDLYFSGITEGNPGIGDSELDPEHAHFSVDLSCGDIQGCTPFGPDIAFTGRGNGTIPEPATIALFGIGIVPALVRRRRRKS
jgi:PEP-CTERM motif-containing protein